VTPNAEADEMRQAAERRENFMMFLFFYYKL
jgi:hypothetical protein